MTEISNRVKALAYGVEIAKARPEASPILFAQEFLSFLEPQPAGDVPASTPAASSDSTKKQRGRPKKEESATPVLDALAAPNPTPASVGAAIGDFLDETPAPAATTQREYTKDEVRNGLVAYGNLTSQAKAREVMEVHGKSATVSGIAKEMYAIVVAETKKAYDAAGGDKDKWPVK